MPPCQTKAQSHRVHIKKTKSMVTFTWEKMAPSFSPSLTAVKGSTLSLSANGRHRSAGMEALRGAVFVIVERAKDLVV